MRPTLVVCGETFETKRALEERLKGILREAVPGVEFDEPEHSFLLCVLFRHPQAVEKIGPGVRAFRVTTTKYKNRCFEAVRMDGSTVEFSYVSCARGESCGEPRDHLGMGPAENPLGDREPGSVYPPGGPR